LPLATARQQIAFFDAGIGDAADDERLSVAA
jgi:hypothetical protein